MPRAGKGYGRTPFPSVPRAAAPARPAGSCSRGGAAAAAEARSGEAGAAYSSHGSAGPAADLGAARPGPGKAAGGRFPPGRGAAMPGAPRGPGPGVGREAAARRRRRRRPPPSPRLGLCRGAAGLPPPRRSPGPPALTGGAAKVGPCALSFGAGVLGAGASTGHGGARGAVTLPGAEEGPGPGRGDPHPRREGGGSSGEGQRAGSGAAGQARTGPSSAARHRPGLLGCRRLLRSGSGSPRCGVTCRAWVWGAGGVTKHGAKPGLVSEAQGAGPACLPPVAFASVPAFTFGPASPSRVGGKVRAGGTAGLCAGGLTHRAGA